MWFVTRQSFIETPDGIRSLFTTAQNYRAGTIWVYQGSLVVEPDAIVEILPNQVQFIEQTTRQQWVVDSGTPNQIVLVDHGLAQDDQIVLFSTETMPEGLVHGGVYYVLLVDQDHFQVSLVASGPAVVFTDSGSGDFWLASQSAPVYESGALWYNAFLENGTASQVLADGLWVQDDFIELFYLTPEQFGMPEDPPELFEQRVAYALHSASIMVRVYLSRNNCIDFYTDAKSPTPQNVERTEMFRYVEGVLAFKMLFEEPGVIGKGPVAEHIEKYTDAIQITKRYQAYGAQKFTSIIKMDYDKIFEMFLSGFISSSITTLPYVKSKYVSREGSVYSSPDYGRIEY